MSSPIENIRYAVPEYFNEEYPRFVKFVQDYYAWLYRNGGFTRDEVDIIKNEENWFVDNIEKYVRTKDIRYVSSGDEQSQELAIIRASDRNNPGKFSDEFMSSYHMDRVFEFFETADGEHFDAADATFDAPRRTDEYIRAWTESLSFLDPKTLAETQDLDKFLLIRLLKYIYKIKGTKKAIELFFNIFLDTPVSITDGTLDIFLPKRQLSIIDDNFVPDGNNTLRDDEYWNEYTYVIRIHDPTGVAETLFNEFYYRYIHPAGFKAVIENTALNTNTIPTVVPIIKAEDYFLFQSSMFTRRSFGAVFESNRNIRFVDGGIARFEHSPQYGTIQGVKFERHSVNLYTNNDSLEGVYRFNGVTISNPIDGVGITDSIVEVRETDAEDEHYFIIRLAVKAGKYYNVSMIVRGRNRGLLSIGSDDLYTFDRADGRNIINYDIANRNVRAGVASDYGNITRLRDEYSRIEWGGYALRSDNFIHLKISLQDATGKLVYAGDSESGIDVSDIQVEEFDYQHRATSIIRTGNAVMPRESDVLEVMPSNDWFNYNAGTFYFLFTCPAYTMQSKVLFKMVGNMGHYVAIRMIDSLIQLVYYDRDENEFNIISGIEYEPYQQIKLAVTYNNTGLVVAYVDGFKLDTTGDTKFRPWQLFVGNNEEGTESLESEILNIDYYPVALLERALIPMTT